MKIEKSFDIKTGQATIKTNTYQRTVSFINLLMGEALKDFPTISADNCSVVVFGPPRSERMVGIQFQASENDVPAEYNRLGGHVLCDYYLL
jgi:hypothetical protein